MQYPKSLNALIENLESLPGIGEKTAERLAFAMIGFKPEALESFSKSILDVKNKIKKCNICHNFTEGETCDICNDKTREKGILCIVEDQKNVILFEKYKIFNGKYHVLEGLISPINDINPEDLNLSILLERIKAESIKEIIIAVKPTLEGEATALYLQKFVESTGVNVTKIAHGIPIGTDMEYLDPITLENALFDRKRIS